MCRVQALKNVLAGADRSGASVSVMMGVEAAAAVVCPPGNATTDPILLQSLLSEIASLGRPIFALFNHPARAPDPINP